MTTPTPKQLIAINLRYGTTARSLKVLAFADLSAKALFLYGNLKSTQEIAKHVAKLMVIPAISEDLIKAGLDELRDDKKIFLQDRKWSLTKEVRDKMRQEVLLANSKLDSVIDRHFPKNIEKEKLKHWFNDAIVDFFSYNGDNWVESVCKGTQNFSKKIKTPDELLDKSVEMHFSEKEADALKKSFRGFLTSTLQEDQAFLTSVGFAMFSARLVAADVGADPIMIEELKNAAFLVDTNFLFALQLDSHKFTSSLRVLGKALKTIGVKLQYIHETKEEYERVWTGRKAEVLKLLEVYPNEVVFGADDDFIATALIRGCKQTEDFNRFFNSIFQLPEKILEGPILNLLDDEKVVEETNKAKRDAELKRAIQRWCLKLRPIWNNPKSRLALEHDASLIYVAEFEKRSGNKTFILTLDRSLQACTAERVGNHAMPLAIYLEGLIQILAANNAGLEFDATNFAPLMSSILLKRCAPSEQTYSTQDLHWLYKIQKNVAEFNPDKIRVIALEVAKARLAGKLVDDKKLQRTVNRLYQEEIQNNDQKVAESLDRAREAEEKAQSEKSKRLELENVLQTKEKKEALKQARERLIKTLLWRIPVAVVLAVAVYYVASLTLAMLKRDNLLDFIVSAGTLFVGGYRFLKNPIREYQYHKKNISEK